MNIAEEEWAAALASLKSDAVLGGRLDEITADLGVDLDALPAPVPSTLDALFDNSGAWTLEAPARWLLGAMIVTRMKSFAARAQKVEGDLELGERRIVLGDLDVRGKLELKHDLIVLGDLNVAKFSRDTYMDISHLIVSGSITCGQGLFSEGGLFVGGRVSAPLITLTFNQGFAKILGGVKARVLIESDHGGSRIFGPIDAATVTCDELVTDDPDRENASMADVAKQLTPNAASAIAELESLDAATKLVELVAEGEPIF